VGQRVDWKRDDFVEMRNLPLFSLQERCEKSNQTTMLKITLIATNNINTEKIIENKI
jgi:hypothetical protein